MSDVLQKIARMHKERVEKQNKIRLRKKSKLDLCVAYFNDSGIPEMWAEVKDIKIPNPVPDIVEGLTITLADLVVKTDLNVIQGTGLALYHKSSDEASWYVQDQSNDNAENAEPYYYHNDPPRGRNNFCVCANDSEAKNNKTKFVDSFIRWLSKYITPQMLAEMDIEVETPSLTKRSRKILQLAET